MYATVTTTHVLFLLGFFECDITLFCRLCSLDASDAPQLGSKDRCRKIVLITGVYLRKFTMSEPISLSESKNLKSYFFLLAFFCHPIS
jgi:hypothetical protein